MSKEEKSEKDLLEEISGKLDKLIAIISVSNLGSDVDAKIKFLKNLGWDSIEIGPFVNLSSSRVRERKGWTGK